MPSVLTMIIPALLYSNRQDTLSGGPCLCQPPCLASVLVVPSALMNVQEPSIYPFSLYDERMVFPLYVIVSNAHHRTRSFLAYFVCHVRFIVKRCPRIEQHPTVSVSCSTPLPTVRFFALAATLMVIPSWRESPPCIAQTGKKQRPHLCERSKVSDRRCLTRVL